MKLGAFIEQGPMNWQILQQNNGWAQIHLAGSWANERLAAVALHQIYGKGKGFEAPDLIEVRKTAQDKVSLLFDHVKNRIYTFDVPEDALPITAIDDTGHLRIRKYEVKGSNELELTFDRVIKGRCQVNGASEQNPKPVIPVDFDSHLPMLSFYGVDVVPL